MSENTWDVFKNWFVKGFILDGCWSTRILHVLQHGGLATVNISRLLIWLEHEHASHVHHFQSAEFCRYNTASDSQHSARRSYCPQVTHVESPSLDRTSAQWPNEPLLRNSESATVPRKPEKVSAAAKNKVLRQSLHLRGNETTISCITPKRREDSSHRILTHSPQRNAAAAADCHLIWKPWSVSYLGGDL
jgi:hypothetical protein